MADYTVRQIDEMDALYRGSYKRARAELGVTAFGIQVIDIPPGATRYPEHDHAGDGQEEVYMTMRGAGELEIEGERIALHPETMVRVASGTMRKVWPGDDGIRLVIVGGVPGGVYEAPPHSELGAPAPTAA
jgi:quercetin dioxygenase-like cupin family protein